MKRYYTGQLTNIPDNGIFVFGSNTQGRHGKGAALVAKEKFGAIYGRPSGLQGRSYAIITKDLTKDIHPSFPKSEIELQIMFLYYFAEDNLDKDFYIAYSGHGKNLNAYTPKEMASMFNSHAIPENIIFEQEFLKLIKSTNKQ